MSIEHTIPAEDVWKVVEPVVDKIVGEVADKIRQLNGDKTVSACFVVGGGGKVHGFTEKLAEELDLPEERVALRGEEVLGEVTFKQEDIKKDPLLVTPIGICLNYYEQRNNFIMVKFNGERLKLYDNNRLTIVDAALQAGFPNDELFPKRGTPINFTVNGVARMVRGEAGEGAIVTMNGSPAHINTPLEPNSEIIIKPSTAGDNAVYTISQLDEYHNSKIYFVINGRKVVCPRFVQVNGKLEPEDYSIKEGDVIETRSYYTVGQIARFMDIVVDTDQMILVNNEEADMDTLVYENFSVEWKEDEYGVARTVNNNYNDTQEPDVYVNDTQETDSEAAVEENEAVNENGSSVAETAAMVSGTEEQADAGITDVDTTTVNTTTTTVVEEAAEAGLNTADKGIQTEADTADVDTIATEAENTADKQDSTTEAEAGNSITVIVNGEPVELMGKESYIFVDIFSRITFDLQAGKGRAIATVINGRDAQFAEELHDGDKIELYWKEN